ncbi:Hydrogen peroxide-inducible genes activator =_ OxyR [hydrothermal vent metagenome]|uniref:Hydrogen peroxide-inducible genes activator => OxyR n=1 Tax=hydrothermal vent metagenome TaxID=652676 RepID=A0A3B0TJD5_9ZZZZ
MGFLLVFLIMQITLKQMRYALALAREAHFSRAAARCHITQPALSQQIRLLEDTCRARIFKRDDKTVRPTPFGREFLQRIEPIIKQVDDLSAHILAHDGKPARPLRFGLIPTIAPYLLPVVFPALGLALPELELAISENHTETLLAAIDNGDLDIGLIATEPPAGAGFAIAEIFADPFVLAAPASQHSLDAPVHLDAIEPGQILLLNEGHCLRDQAIAACALSESQSANSFAATSLSTIVEFVANGQGVTLLPTISLEKEAADQRIKIMPLAAPGACRMLNLVWHNDTPFTQLYHQIADIIRTAGQTRLKSLTHKQDVPVIQPG